VAGGDRNAERGCARVFLYALDNAAAVHKRVDNVQIRPDSWAALLRTWRILRTG